MENFFFCQKRKIKKEKRGKCPCSKWIHNISRLHFGSGIFSPPLPAADWRCLLRYAIALRDGPRNSCRGFDAPHVLRHYGRGEGEGVKVLERHPSRKMRSANIPPHETAGPGRERKGLNTPLRRFPFLFILHLLIPCLKIQRKAISIRQRNFIFRK